MSKHNLTGPYHQTINLIASNDSWIIAKDAVIAAVDGVGIRGVDTFSGNKIIVQGVVSGEVGAMQLGAERTHVTIAASGAAYGAVYLGGDGSKVSNFGKIISKDYGIVAEGKGTAVSNDGTIVARVGILTDHADGTIINGKHGFISAAISAFSIGGDDSDTLRLVNRGRIESDDAAIITSAPKDTIINTGHIAGDIDLGTGNDLFDTRGGTFKGILQGEGGDDTLITGSTKIHLVEQDLQGRDTVKSTVSYALNDFVERLFLLGKSDINGSGNAQDNVLNGNIGNNVLTGKDGGDTLDGGLGNDILRGGAGNDLFGFATGYGKDTIADFENADLIYLANWKAIGNFTQLKVHAENHGADVWITAGDDTLVIEHVHKADLAAGDFQF